MPQGPLLIASACPGCVHIHIQTGTNENNHLHYNTQREGGGGEGVYCYAWPYIGENRATSGKYCAKYCNCMILGLGNSDRYMYNHDGP